MALNKAQLEAALLAMMQDARADKTPQEAAQQLADAIDAYVRTGTAGPDPVV